MNLLQQIKLPFALKNPVLALGSHIKNTVCFARKNRAYISGISSDLSSPEDYACFRRNAEGFLKKRPRIIAYDLHPEYISSVYGQSLKARFSFMGIQHHHAHIASCMAENGLKDSTVIGVSFDGTGFGADSSLWGAEFLLAGYRKFIRYAHLKEVALIGAAQAILEPWRVAALWLYRIYGEKMFRLDIDFIKKVNKGRFRRLQDIYRAGINSPLASSMGRLFDAAASIILSKTKAGCEAELAIKLESLAWQCQKNVGKEYSFKISGKKGNYVLEPEGLFMQITSDLKNKRPAEEVAYGFHLAVAEGILRICQLIRKDKSLNRVALSGGVFQNKLLLSMTLDLLYKHGFMVFKHNKIPCNDAGISLGQAIIAGVQGED